MPIPHKHTPTRINVRLGTAKTNKANGAATAVAAMTARMPTRSYIHPKTSAANASTSMAPA